MKRNSERIVVVILAVTAGVVICCNGVQRHRAEVDRGLGSGREMTAAPSRSTAEDISAEALAQIGDRIAGSLRSSFAAELEFLLNSLFDPDFDMYAAHMRGRGLELDEMATEFARIALPGPGDARDRLRAAWNDPHRRLMHVERVDPGRIMAGLGLKADESAGWPEPMSASQMSLFAPPEGRLRVEQADQIDTIERAAWVQIPLRLSGRDTHIRLVLLHHSEERGWIPLFIVVGMGPRHMPLLVL